eukprot:scaffold9547_cov102-Isochrysis_galbana.AAC.3
MPCNERGDFDCFVAEPTEARFSGGEVRFAVAVLGGVLVGVRNRMAYLPATSPQLGVESANTSGNSTEFCLAFALRSLPLPLPLLSPSLFLLQAAFCGGMVVLVRAACVHYYYYSLGLGIGSLGLGFSVVLSPVSASLSTSLRAHNG